MNNNQLEAYPTQAQPKAKRSGCMRLLVDILETLVLIVVLFVGVNIISARIRVDGDSMMPTLISGEYLVVNRLSYRLGNPQRGDIIVFHPPLSTNIPYIKRIIGLPGDTVEVKEGALYINGQPLDESYIHVKMNYSGRWVVPEDQLFVLGDNRNNSKDSHESWTVPMDSVVGKAVAVYWPPPEWGFINHVPQANAAR